RSKGASATIAYEHLWSPEFKTAVGLSAYRTQTDLKDFKWRTEGLLAQVGAEWNPTQGLYLGAELNYYWDRVKGVFFALPGDAVGADFVNAMVYARRTF